MGWSSLMTASTTSEQGSEGGAIMVDDEHSDGARITLESCALSAPFAITCGIYGWMMHTRFLSDEPSAQRAVMEMKLDIEMILSGISLNDDPMADQRTLATIDAITRFVDRYPT
jgi:hypothetical protein